MTRQRYIKLFYALMQRINQKNIELLGTSAKDWGKVLKGVQAVKFGTKQAPHGKSYAEAWESLKPVREAYGM